MLFGTGQWEEQLGLSFELCIQGFLELPAFFAFRVTVRRAVIRWRYIPLQLFKLPLPRLVEPLEPHSPAPTDVDNSPTVDVWVISDEDSYSDGEGSLYIYDGEHGPVDGPRPLEEDAEDLDSAMRARAELG